MTLSDLLLEAPSPIRRKKILVRNRNIGGKTSIFTKSYIPDVAKSNISPNQDYDSFLLDIWMQVLMFTNGEGGANHLALFFEIATLSHFYPELQGVKVLKRTDILDVLDNDYFNISDSFELNVPVFNLLIERFNKNVATSIIKKVHAEVHSPLTKKLRQEHSYLKKPDHNMLSRIIHSRVLHKLLAPSLLRSKLL